MCRCHAGSRFERLGGRTTDSSNNAYLMLEATWRGIGQLVATFTGNEHANYFTNAGKLQLERFIL